MSPLFLFQDRFETQRLRPQVRVFLPIGFFASVAGNALRPGGRSVRRPHLPRAHDGRAPSFWTIDAAVGWRLPRRLGSISLEGTNLADEQFPFYEQSLQENLIPARRVVLRADFAF